MRHPMRGEGHVAERAASLQASDIAFIACANTLDRLGEEKSDVLPGVEMVKNGLPVIVQKVVAGWIKLRP